jgi:hypothetical protein
MGLNIDNRKTYHIFDVFTGLMRNQDEAKNPDLLKAHGDGIGHTVDAFLAYGYKPFVDAVKHCFKEEVDEKGSFIQGYRSPYHFGIEPNTMSRDHIINALVLMKLEDKVFLKKLSKKLRWKISDRYSFTIDSWLWMKGISGNKLAMFFYYVIDIPFLLFSVIWNKIIYKLGKFGKEVPQDEFVLVPEDDISDKKKKLRKLVYPMYALHQKAFQLYVTPNSIGKWLTKKIALWGVDKQNFLLRIMFGGKVNSKDVYSYKSMCGGRFSTYLNQMNDRFLKIIDNPEHIEENVVDVDLLRKMYKKIGKK